jgi:Mitochondrial 18 KDa protein (MTP18).
LIETTQFPRLVRPTYFVAFGYCAADALTSGHNKWNEDDEMRDGAQKEEETARRIEIESDYLNSKQRNTAIATFDTLVWQCKFHD